MPLTCSCPDYIDADWFWHEPEDYTILGTRRRKRCQSCNELIDVGATCLEFPRTRDVLSDVEEKIFGAGAEAVPLASWWHCERCADLWFSLSELGFCVDPGEDMRGLVKEYAEGVASGDGG